MITDGAPDLSGDSPAADIAREAEERLQRHLENWLGIWPNEPGVFVSTSQYRSIPGWDGQLRSFAGVASPETTVISVAPDAFDAAQRAVQLGGLDELGARLDDIVGKSGAHLRRGVFRYQQRLVAHDSLGTWRDPSDPFVPEWLRPFNAKVLMAFDGQGHYAAGVGRKRHDPFGQELAVTTEPAHQRRGYARQLVAQAAEKVYLEGSVATYLHRRENTGSAAVAEATGFFDRGWEIISLSIADR